MNKVCRILWNADTRPRTAVSEVARAHGKSAQASVSVPSTGARRRISRRVRLLASVVAVVTGLSGFAGSAMAAWCKPWDHACTKNPLGMLPQTPAPGKSLLGVANTNYAGQSAVGVGLSTSTANGKWIFKGGSSTTTRGTVAVGASVGYVW